MRSYYIVRGRFANEYSLYWAESGATIPECFERITRKEAEAACKSENDRRKYNGSFSCYADNAIYPAVCHYEPFLRNNTKKTGYVAELN